MKKRYRFIQFNLMLLMLVFIFALSSPLPSSNVKDFFRITGDVTRVDELRGCVSNVFSDDTVLGIIEDRIDYSKYHNLVVIRDIGDYYLLYYHNGYLKDSYDRSFMLLKGDRVCYEFNDLPEYVDI